MLKERKKIGANEKVEQMKVKYITKGILPINVKISQ